MHRRRVLTALTLKLRAAAGPTEPPGSIYVKVPGWGDSPDVELFTDLEDGWRVVELDELGELGTGTTTIESYTVGQGP